MLLFFIALIILSLLALVVLNRFYELEPWFKRILMGVLLIGVIGSIASFFLKNKKPETPKVQVEQIDPSSVDNTEETKVISENDEYLKQAEALEKRIKQLLSNEVPNKRTNIKNTRMRRYNRDSLLIMVETAEQLLKSRKRFLANDRIAYIEGNKNATDFSSAINRYKNDLDSLVNNFKLNP